MRATLRAEINPRVRDMADAFTLFPADVGLLVSEADKWFTDHERQVFDREGAVDGFARWPAWSPQYAKWRKKHASGQRERVKMHRFMDSLKPPSERATSSRKQPYGRGLVYPVLKILTLTGGMKFAFSDRANPDHVAVSTQTPKGILIELGAGGESGRIASWHDQGLRGKVRHPIVISVQSSRALQDVLYKYLVNMIAQRLRGVARLVGRAA